MVADAWGFAKDGEAVAQRASRISSRFNFTSSQESLIFVIRSRNETPSQGQLCMIADLDDSKGVDATSKYALM
jgi:hypothetical protein